MKSYFSKKGGLSKHKHIHTGQKTLRCKICVKTFSEKGYLTKHESKHIGKKSDVYFMIKDAPEMDTYWDMNAHILERKQYDLCVAKAEDWINAFSQSIHWNGFPPVWLNLCVVKWEDWLNTFSQSIHLNGVSSVWLNLCLVKTEDWLNAFHRAYIWIVFSSMT